MENNSYKRRLDDMYDQSSSHSSSKRKRAHVINSSSGQGQPRKKSLLEPFEEQYKFLVSTPRMRQGTPFSETRHSFAARPYVAQGTGFVAGGFYESTWTPRTPLRQRHYSPRRPWNNGTVAEVSARSPVNVLGLCNTPEALSSATVTDLPSHFARSSPGNVSHTIYKCGRSDWSDSGKKFGVANRRYRLITDVSVTRVNGMFMERLVSGKLPENIVLAKLKEENRALEKKLHAVRREPGMCGDLSSGGTEVTEREDMSEFDAMMLKNYRNRIAALQGDDKRLSDISKTCSNLQEARYVSPDSVVNKAIIVSALDASGKVLDGDNQQSGKVADGGKLANTREHRDDSHHGKADDWKALYEQAKSREAKIQTLKLEAEYAEKQFAALSLNRPTVSKAVKKDERDVPDAFTPLSEEAEDEVEDALQGPDRNKVLIFHEKSSIDVTRAVMQCLLPGAWLNDEVINLYMELLKEREVQEPKKFLKCHFFNTFFYNKLFKDKRSYDYKSVRRWTTQKKLGYSLSDCDKILVPIHQDIHWCLAVINIRDKKLEYLDSLKGGDNAVLKVLARYIADEAKDKDGKVLDSNTWEHDFPQDIPEQLNGCDCGMFMLKYADFHSRGVPLSFKQADMPYFRRRMVWELLQLKAT